MPSPSAAASSSSLSAPSNSAVTRGRVLKRKQTRKIQPPKVLKVLQTVMEKAAASEATGVDPSHNEFFNTGRVGRRNAMPDILGQHCRTTTADLPDQLSALSTQDGPVLAVTDSDGGGATAEATACFTVTTDTATTSSTMQKADDSSNS